MEWTPEALKAEAEYRQCARRTAAHHTRLARKTSRGWWHRLTNRH
ncbi:hypothetical protein ACFFQW_05260 [Umezawaea endophytica]|uniref:Uncharacterized protein n=1 Tax=Umezawaea endophytica TaxID=1654476 RepID=A0A9X2VGU9_9PSEU|nr:hypothetical protein [Umezawaea endophytica]MCS7476217.1 hypothetical protein [Umezawaea endophytica]